VTAIAREMGRHRSTVYDDIGRLRARFETAGLADYVRRRPTDRDREP
jgi:hypothetical protein